jgi:ABC-type bacteriocin/lantibiotic exporter with double-glycine peptidase domain
MSALWYQTDRGTCAQRSLVHALHFLGHSISESQALKACGLSRQLVNQFGTNETQIKRAISFFGYRFSVLRSSSRLDARRFINKHLANGSPIIISVRSEKHWAVIAKRMKDKYMWIDSADLRLVGRWSLPAVLDWMEYTNHGKSEYFALAITSRKLV